MEEVEQMSDLIRMLKFPNVDYKALIEVAYKRGLTEGKNIAKARMIEAIEQEK